MPFPSRATARRLRTLLGATLLAATLLPAYRLLDPRVTGLAGVATRQVAEVVWAGDLWGTLIVITLAVMLARVAPGVDPLAALRGLAKRLARWDTKRFAALCGVVALVLSLVSARVVLRGLPSSVDEMVQLLHARVLLTGRLALPLPSPGAAWVVQNSLITGAGWASVYPPMHTAILALGLAIGTPWLVGPVMMGVAAVCVTLAFDRLLPDRLAVARSAALLAAACPFLFFLGGSQLSHTTALAFAALTLWTALRARDGGPAWGVATGAAVGAFVCARPWTGVAISVALLASVWRTRAGRAKTGRVRWLSVRAAATLAGGLPFAALLLGWDHVLFGHAFTLGYSAAYGPAHGLGFHADPWGNAYGLREAVAYTGADIGMLGGLLLETPLPATALVGAGLLMSAALGEGVSVLVAWALAGVAANFVYWHHGIHMGPRLLFETGPAWVGLWVVALPRLARGTGGTGFARRAVGWTGMLCLAAAPLLAWERGVAYRTGSEVAAAEHLPQPGGPRALVFLHGSWSARNAARLVAAGMRRDSVETALRRNDVCQVDAYARWRAGEGPGPPPSLDLTPLPGTAPNLEVRELSPGNRVAVTPGAAPSVTCAREAHSDRLGTLELEPLLWQAPPVDDATVVVARDLGPADNARALASLPGYTPWVAVDGGPGRPPRLLRYPAGMELLWGGAAPPARR